MSNDEDDRRAWCHPCDGEGRVPDPKTAIIDDMPQTVVTSRACRWCDGTGRRRSLHLPI